MESARRAGAAIATAALLGIFVTSCGAAEPDQTDTPSTSVTEAANQPSNSLDTAPGSAVGTVRAWIAARNDALSDGDTAAAAALGESCDTCDDLLARIERVHSAGGSFRGGRWHVGRAIVTEQSGETVTVAADITVGATTERRSRGSEPEAVPRDELSLRFVIDPSDRAPVRQIVFLRPQAGGAASSVGGMVGG